MTRPYSDSQLDAMAAARKYGAVPCPACDLPMLPEHPHNHHSEPRPGYDPMPVKPTTREGLIAVIAHELVGEVSDRMHTWAVPSELESIALDGWLDGPTLEVTDTGELGAPSFAPAFARYIGGIHWDDDRDLLADGHKPTPWLRNLDGIRRWCSGKHQTWYEHQGKPLCWTLTRLVVMGGYSLGRAGQSEGVSPEKAESLVFGFQREDGKHQDGAIDKWWSWTANDLNGLTAHRVPRKAA